jgi:hypothetical protein
MCLKVVLVLVFAGLSSAASVIGTAYGFAKGITPTDIIVILTDNAQLVGSHHTVG